MSAPPIWDSTTIASWVIETACSNAGQIGSADNFAVHINHNRQAPLKLGKLVRSKRSSVDSAPVLKLVMVSKPVSAAKVILVSLVVSVTWGVGRSFLNQGIAHGLASFEVSQHQHLCQV